MDKTRDISPDDQLLWSAFRQGDEHAFGKIAQKYYQSLFSYGSKFSVDREFVKDCMQELYYEMWERRETLGNTDFVKFYLFKSLRRKIYRESSKKTGPSLEIDLDEAMENVGGITIEEQIIDLETREEKLKWVNQRILQMSKRQQEVIHLKFFEELDNDSIGQIMSLSKQSVANLLHRSMLDLKANI
jgi:RNA polymerase sigma factor (sigma-70 family)